MCTKSHMMFIADLPIGKATNHRFPQNSCGSYAIDSSVPIGKSDQWTRSGTRPEIRTGYNRPPGRRAPLLPWPGKIAHPPTSTHRAAIRMTLRMQIVTFWANNGYSEVYCLPLASPFITQRHFPKRAGPQPDPDSTRGDLTRIKKYIAEAN